MNRREFTKGLAAAGLAPALPLPSIAKAAPAAMAVKDPMYFWASFVSRVHNKCSPAMLTRLLKLEPEHSAKLFSQLLADGAVTAPDIYGLSQSTNPLYPEYSRVMGHGNKLVNSVDDSSNKDILKDRLSDQNEPHEDTIPEGEAPTDPEDIAAQPDDSQEEASETDTEEAEQDPDAQEFTSP